MSARVCYLSRADRGARIAAARVVGGRLDERWASDGPENGSVDPRAEAQAAAAWVGDRLTQGEGDRRRLRYLCLDADGATCSWLTAPSADQQVVAAAMVHGIHAEHADHSGGESRGSQGAFGAWGDVTTGEATLQALATPATPSRRERRSAPAQGPGRRFAALSVPDVSARLFLDALDDRGVSADAVVSIWHALAAAWDPGGAAGRAPGTGGAREDRIVATATPPSAIVVIDPEGRLVWSWSRAGDLLAAGTIRLVGRGGSAGEDGVRVAGADIARLTADWLAWSAQLGVVPARIVCVGPGAESVPAALSPAQLGEALGRACPGATVDLAVHDDPIGATLHRLAELPADGSHAPEDPRAALVPLSHRPARAHRSLLRAAALALLLGAAGFTGVAWRAWSAAGQIRGKVNAARDEKFTLIQSVLPQVGREFPENELNDELAKLRAAQSAGKDIDVAKPILQELDVISAVLTTDMKPETISLHFAQVMVTVIVPSITVGKELVDSIQSIAGSSCEWKEGDWSQTGDKYKFILMGAWRKPAAGAGQ